MNRFWNFTENPDDTEDVELRIEGDITMDDDFWSTLLGIETVTPKGFRAELEKHKGKNLTVWINSYGGDVYAASQIYTALMEHKGAVTVKVDGVAISAASVIAMAGTDTYMSPTSIMMIHNPCGCFQGDAKDMRQAANILDEVKETIVNAYQIKTGRSRSKIAKMMDEETWMSAKKAQAEGFADGMLYADKAEPALVENSFMFSRLAIQNSAAESMKRFVAQYNQKLAEAGLAPDPEVEGVTAAGTLEATTPAPRQTPVEINSYYEALIKYNEEVIQCIGL